MVFNDSIRYVDGGLMVDGVAVDSIVSDVGTPVYIYSLNRVLRNYRRLRMAFGPIGARIHYSAKANSSGAILRALIEAGAGIDAVSGGEIARALHAGAEPSSIVFAGVGKSAAEIQYAVEKNIGCFNVENVEELAIINAAAGAFGRGRVQVALRFNPDVRANTHPQISTGHSGAQFGMSEEEVRQALSRAACYPRLDISGVHMHIGSQLGDAAATKEALEKLRALVEPYAAIDSINLGGGLPVAYRFAESVPPLGDFVDAIEPLMEGYRALVEPGRSIVADAGILVSTVLYVKRQAGVRFIIIDAGMTEMIRPALYGAYHEIAPLVEADGVEVCPARVVGPVCETTDVLAAERDMPELEAGDCVAIMTAGAYGMAMASNYNSRLRPAEVAVEAGGGAWRVSRRRESVGELMQFEL